MHADIKFIAFTVLCLLVIWLTSHLLNKHRRGGQ
jgi:hypothetical protein